MREIIMRSQGAHVNFSLVHAEARSHGEDFIFHGQSFCRTSTSINNFICNPSSSFMIFSPRSPFIAALNVACCAISRPQARAGYGSARA